MTFSADHLLRAIFRSFRTLPQPAAAAQARARSAASRVALGVVLAASALLGLAPHAAAAEVPLERLQVADPYLEMRTGPGRDYPVFFVVGRYEWVEIDLRYTDWFRVRAPTGQVGWVNRHQLESTLTEAGSKRSFRDVLLDDYLKRRVEFGAAWGHFSGDPVLKLFMGYNLTDTLVLEADVGQVQGSYSGTDFWHVDLLVQPWSERRLEPFFGIGVGRFNNVPNASLVGASTSNSNLANAMVGVRYHVTDRLIARLDWAAYTSLISPGRTDQYHALTAGLSFFF